MTTISVTITTYSFFHCKEHEISLAVYGDERMENFANMIHIGE
jgi:hypothetical protein